MHKIYQIYSHKCIEFEQTNKSLDAKYSQTIMKRELKE